MTDTQEHLTKPPGAGWLGGMGPGHKQLGALNPAADTATPPGAERLTTASVTPGPGGGGVRVLLRTRGALPRGSNLLQRPRIPDCSSPQVRRSGMVHLKGPQPAPPVAPNSRASVGRVKTDLGSGGSCFRDEPVGGSKMPFIFISIFITTTVDVGLMALSWSPSGPAQVHQSSVSPGDGRHVRTM